MKAIAEQLISAGFEITSSWINDPHDADVDATQDYMCEAALQNVADIEDADMMLHFSQPQGTSHTGGGRHWEFGFAYASGMPIFVIGPKGEQVFHYLPDVKNFETIQDFIAYMSAEPEAGDS